MLIRTDIPPEDEMDLLVPPSIVVVIPGEMRGKGRPRFTARGGFARAYSDAKTVTAENWVRTCAVEKFPSPIAGAVDLEVEICVTVPKSWPKRRRELALRGCERPTSKPDLDNSIKLIADALNGIAWDDDKQIVRVTACKLYDEQARTTLTVRRA